MSENTASEGVDPPQTTTGTAPEGTNTTNNVNPGTTSRGRYPRRDGRPNSTGLQPNSTGLQVARDFKGDTPDIGGIIALRSENVNMKISYDQFCEK